MPSATKSEVLALEEAGALLRFAAEHANKLQPEIALAVAKAVQAQETGAWTPEISRDFWCAYSRLSELIKPVTIDCIGALNPTLPRRRYWLWGPQAKALSVAEATSRRYVFSLILTLLAALAVQLYEAGNKTVSDSLASAVADAQAQSAALSKQYAALNSATWAANARWTASDSVAAQTIGDKADQLTLRAQSALSTASSLEGWTTLGFQRLSAQPAAQCPPDPAGRIVDQEWWCKGEKATALWSYTVQTLNRVRAQTQLVDGILTSFVLPLLLGMTGALAYVVRLISDQIKTTTFSSASPLRHLMRVALGALMGAVVGLFSGFTAQLDLSPLAIAFLAGYGVEATFSIFDGLIGAFQKVARSLEHGEAASPRA